MGEIAAYNAWLHRYAVLTSSCTFLLVISGGLVTSTGSGLAVPDWPLSYGMFFPDDRWYCRHYDHASLALGMAQ